MGAGSITPLLSRNRHHRTTTHEVYEHRKANHLYFRSGERYSLGHTCRIKQLQCIYAGFEELPLHLDDSQEVDIKVTVDLDTNIPEALCLSALSGNYNGVNTILVAGWVKKRPTRFNGLLRYAAVNRLTMVEIGCSVLCVQTIE
ncbi:hypothetical protein H5410_002999 [Solanum commersonii]|uniref:Uncharacterized protein n=1 Tax=Solanum commersonii TaxID=4109 RepID=A0A9J6B3W7_SOLCO|nr:hypothetical protein H5410_002999 [Solanum commersonii]